MFTDDVCSEALSLSGFNERVVASVTSQLLDTVVLQAPSVQSFHGSCSERLDVMISVPQAAYWVDRKERSPHLFLLSHNRDMYVGGRNRSFQRIIHSNRKVGRSKKNMQNRKKRSSIVWTTERVVKNFKTRSGRRFASEQRCGETSMCRVHLLRRRDLTQQHLFVRTPRAGLN